jgi:DNA-binding protein YbaB
MSGPVDSTGLDRLLGQAMQALGQARGVNTEADEDAEPILGYGEGADGMIQVTAETGGRLTDIQLDPRVLRLTTVDLGTELVVAVNAALADLQARIREAVAAPDLDNLAAQLKEVQEQSTKQMGTFLQALVDAQERIASSGRR